MKKYFSLVVVMIFIASFSTIVRAESPVSIMSDVLSLPDNPCTLPDRDKEHFRNKVSKLKTRNDTPQIYRRS